MADGVSEGIIEGCFVLVPTRDYTNGHEYDDIPFRIVRGLFAV